MVEILENRDAWYEKYQNQFVAHVKETGQTNFKETYDYSRNQEAPAGPPIDLSQSRLLLISSAGGYLKDTQTPFDAPNLLGDYSTRLFPLNTPFDKIAYAHDHYDHTAVNADPQVLLPLRHLQTLRDEGIIGDLVPTVMSYSGYQPDGVRVVDELASAILDFAKAENAQAALLVPS